MPLQNRVTPFGDVVAVPERGLLYGNRGCLHDRDGRIVRHADGIRWIACVLEFKGRRRHPLRRPGRFTELFFLDEATALAAGHRPCFECRRADAERFRDAWPGGARRRATEMDAILDVERRGPRPRSPAGGLPAGAMVDVAGQAHLVVDGGLRRWSAGGYGGLQPSPVEPVAVLTPASIVAVLRAGYRPLLHPTALSP